VKLISLIIIALATGCAVGTTPVDGTDNTSDAGGGQKDAGTHDSANAPAQDSSAPDTSTGDNDAAPVVDDSTCAAKSTKLDCEQCCLGVHKPGYAVYDTALKGCACGSSGACATECATEYCAGKSPAQGDACYTCINNALAPSTGTCYGAVGTACTADTDCNTLFQTCIPPCETK
jgi:hypothetical protein